MSDTNRCFVDVHGDGIPVVFIHGYPLNRSMWKEQVGPIAQSFKAVFVDLPGFGPAQPATRLDTTSMAQIADEVFEALQQAKVTEPIVLVGLSMGGYIALEFWKRHSEALRGLVLANTKASADSPEAAETRKKTAKMAMTEGTEPAVTPMIAKLLGPQSQKSPKVMQWLKQTIYSTLPETVEMAMLAMAARSDFTAELGEISIPTLVVASSEDAIIKADEMEKMADAIPNATFAKIDNAGHLTPIEQPDRFNELLLEFLQKV